MGLDMYLRASRYVGLGEGGDENVDKVAEAAGLTGLPRSPFRSATVELTVGYWRKANAIHAWFVKNVQNGVDDCGTYYVDFEQLQELLGICRQLKAEPGKAEELLPTQGGLFFGSTHCDEGYWEDVSNTEMILTEVLTAPRHDFMHYVYQASW